MTITLLAALLTLSSFNGNDVDPDKVVTIAYTDTDGSRDLRQIQPLDIVYGRVTADGMDEWVMEAYDVEKKHPLFFSLKDINIWLGHL